MLTLVLGQHLLVLRVVLVLPLSVIIIALLIGTNHKVYLASGISERSLHLTRNANLRDHARWVEALVVRWHRHLLHVLVLLLLVGMV